MDLTPVAEALILGLIVNFACVGVCLPILVPLIMERDRGWRRGLATAGLFSLGRLVVYMSLGLGLLALGQKLADEPDPSFTRPAIIVAGLALMVYGGWTIANKGGGSGCADQITDEETHPGGSATCAGLAARVVSHVTSGRGMSAIFFGAVVGSLLCPPLWVALAGAVLTLDLTVMILSVLAFWAGSSVSILAVGLASGHLAPRCEARTGRRQLRDIAAVMLIMMGLMYLANGLTG